MLKGPVFVVILVAALLSALARPTVAQRCAGEVLLQIPGEIRVFPLRSTRNDTEMGGNRRSIDIDVSLKSFGSYGVLSGYVKMWELGGDHSRFGRAFSRRIKFRNILRPGCQVPVNWSVSGGLNAQASGSRHGWRYYRVAEGILGRVGCVSDTQGDDRGDLGCVLRFNPIRMPQEPAPGAYGATCAPVRVRLPMIPVENLRHGSPQGRRFRGDTEMGGNRVSINIQYGSRLVDPNQIELSVRVWMKEHGDRTSFMRTVVRRVSYRPRSGCRATAIVNSSSSINFMSRPNDHRWRTYRGGSRIRHAQCLSDTRGDDFGKLGCRVWIQDLVVRTTR